MQTFQKQEVWSLPLYWYYRYIILSYFFFTGISVGWWYSPLSIIPIVLLALLWLLYSKKTWVLQMLDLLYLLPVRLYLSFFFLKLTWPQCDLNLKLWAPNGELPAVHKNSKYTLNKQFSVADTSKNRMGFATLKHLLHDLKNLFYHFKLVIFSYYWIINKLKTNTFKLSQVRYWSK